jgi:DNA-directed RNA polymerase specialized sigma24 family protein
VLVAWFDLTPAEAAVALGVSGASFRMRLARARRRLRAELEGPDHAVVPTEEEPQCHPS